MKSTKYAGSACQFKDKITDTTKQTEAVTPYARPHRPSGVGNRIDMKARVMAKKSFRRIASSWFTKEGRTGAQAIAGDGQASQVAQRFLASPAECGKPKNLVSLAPSIGIRTWMERGKVRVLEEWMQ